MRRGSAWVGCAVAWSLCLAGGAALAQESPEIQLASPEGGGSEEALRLYRLGELHFEGREFKEAAETFERAFALDPNPVLAFNIARSWENDGQLDKARANYKLALSLQPPPEIRTRAESALVRLDRLEEEIKAKMADAAPKLGRLQVRASPSSAQIFINGEARGEAPLEVELAPGSYRVRVEASGMIPQEQALELRAGESSAVSVSLAPAEERAAVSWLGWTGLGMAALGGAGVGLAFVLDQPAQERFDEAQGLDAQRDPARFEELRMEGEDARALAQGVWWGGLGLAVAGVTLFAVDLGLNLSGGEESEAPAASLRVWPGGGGVEVAW